MSNESEILGQVRCPIGGDNAWEAINVTDTQVKVKCVQGPKEGTVTKISRVDFISGMIQVQ